MNKTKTSKVRLPRCIIHSEEDDYYKRKIEVEYKSRKWDHHLNCMGIGDLGFVGCHDVPVRKYLPPFWRIVAPSSLPFYTCQSTGQNILEVLFLNFHTVHFVLFLGITTIESIVISLLFHFAAPTCFGNCVPSSGSSSVPSELHANLGFGW
jgi:hypothetical protein